MGDHLDDHHGYLTSDRFLGTAAGRRQYASLHVIHMIIGLFNKHIAKAELRLLAAFCIHEYQRKGIALCQLRNTSPMHTRSHLPSANLHTAVSQWQT